MTITCIAANGSEQHQHCSDDGNDPAWQVGREFQRHLPHGLRHHSERRQFQAMQNALRDRP